MIKKIIPLTLALALVGCTHTKVASHQVEDKGLSCGEIKRQIRQIEDLKRDIDSKRGFSGRNVGMALFFWPGILVNELNGNEATKMAEERHRVLVELYEKKNCG